MGKNKWNGKYKVVYADPPWQYGNYKKSKQGGVEQHYGTMSIEEIMDLPIEDIADDDCVLFMWTTFPFLEEAFKVIEAWGFKYKTNAFTWVKTNKKQTDTLFWGLGGWTRANAEVCLLATKGKPKRQAADVHQVIMSPIEAHSKKPDEARDRIVQLMGNVPRVELFARQKPKGWHTWGNEVDNDVEI